GPKPPEPVQYLIDDGGRRVTTQFNETTLVRIAAATGGRYVRSAAGSELARALAQVAKDDRRIIGWRSSTDYHDVYPAALAVALIATAGAGPLLWQSRKPSRPTTRLPGPARSARRGKLSAARAPSAHRRW